MANQEDLLESIAAKAAAGTLDPEEAIKALEAEVAALEAKKPPEKPRRLTVPLIAERCIEKMELAQLSQDEVADRVIGLTRLRLDRLRLGSMDGLDVCNGATHVMLQHNQLREIEDLSFFNRLQYLVVAHNHLEALSGLAHLPALQYLDASHNLIAVADATALPPPLMALELTGNPCVERAGYRSTLVGSLPGLVLLDEVHISGKERRAARGEDAGGEGEEEEEEEIEDGEEEEEEEESEEEGQQAGEDRHTDAEVSSSDFHPKPSTFLSGAKAKVSAELAEVDALLERAGMPDAETLLPPPPAAAEGAPHPPQPPEPDSDGPSESTSSAAPIDPVMLYSKALEMYGVNKDAEATQAKMRAIHERVQSRRAALREGAAHVQVA